MKYFKKMIGKNVYLSPMNILDCETYANWMNDRLITDNLGNTSFICSVEGEKEWLESKSSDVRFAIIKKDGDELLGNCSLMNINRIDRSATVGIFIGESSNRGKNYGYEALNLLLEFGFNISNLHNIDLHVFDYNKQAINCYKKVGFKEYGKRSNCHFLNGTYHDEILMEILEDDYRKNKIESL